MHPPDTILLCLKSERSNYLTVGMHYIVLSPVEKYHENPQVSELGAFRRGHADRIDMAWGAFRVVRDPGEPDISEGRLLPDNREIAPFRLKILTRQADDEWLAVLTSATELSRLGEGRTPREAIFRALNRDR